ncbi:MAG: hypothetical protein AB1589_05330 [Cyanobacteriota bacterium]
MLTESVLNKNLENIKGFEWREIISIFRPVLHPRARWSDLEYTTSLEIQYFTYYVVLIEYHGYLSPDIVALKHALFHPNRQALIEGRIGDSSSCSTFNSNANNFCESLKKFSQQNEGEVLAGALVEQLNLLRIFEEQTQKYNKIEPRFEQNKQTGYLTLKSIHEEAFQYFRYGKKLLWHENFIRERKEKESKQQETELTSQFYHHVNYTEPSDQDEYDLGYEGEDGQWYYPGDYPEDNIPD